MSIGYINWDEFIVGAGHPTRPDTLNRALRDLIIASGADPDDPQTLLQTNMVTATGSTTARTLQDRFAEAHNVKDFGALGDGVADDTAAIQAALNAGGATKFPAGQYKITAKLTISTGSDIRLFSESPCAAELVTSFVANPADPTLEITTTGQNITIEGLKFTGNQVLGANGNGHAIAILNPDHTLVTFSPQHVTIRDCRVVGYRGNGKDENGASMPACGLYMYGALENTISGSNIFFHCATGIRMKSCYKITLQEGVADFCDYNTLYLDGCENVRNFGFTLNRGGSGGATDGLAYITGCKTVGFFGARLKEGKPNLITCSDATAINVGVGFFGCSMQQLDPAYGVVGIQAGTGTEGLIIDGCDFLWVNTITTAVGVDITQGPSGRNAAGIRVSNCTFNVGDGGTIVAMVRSNVTSNKCVNLRVENNVFGTQQPAGSATVYTSAVDLRGNCESPIIRGNSFCVSTNRTMTNAILVNTGSVTGARLEDNTYTKIAGTITNELNNAGGATVFKRDISTIVGGGETLLAVISAVDMNSTADQAISIPIKSGGTYILTRITASFASISLTTAAGGIYTAASKGGTAIVAAAQVYSALTGNTSVLNLTLAAVPLLRSEQTLYLSLTTAQGAAAFARIFVFGVPTT